VRASFSAAFSLSGSSRHTPRLLATAPASVISFGTSKVGLRRSISETKMFRRLQMRKSRSGRGRVRPDNQTHTAFPRDPVRSAKTVWFPSETFPTTVQIFFVRIFRRWSCPVCNRLDHVQLIQQPSARRYFCQVLRLVNHHCHRPSMPQSLLDRITVFTSR
jgi:hypothetical protein